MLVTMIAYLLNPFLLARVSVCPPKDTSTNFNKDLINAENVYFDKAARDKLVKLAFEMLENNESILIYEGLKSLKVENLWKNWYLGYTKVELPSTAYTSISTTGIPGSMSSPSFGQYFNEPRIWAELIIDLDMKANLTMVMDVEIVTDGWDYVVKHYPESERYENTGYMNGTWYIPTGNMFRLTYQGYDRNGELSNMTNKGFSVKWYFIDKNTGEKVDSEPRTNYCGYDRNRHFVKMVNIVHFALNNNITVDTLWEQMKQLKKKLLIETGCTLPKKFLVDNVDNIEYNNVVVLIVDQILYEAEDLFKMQANEDPVYKNNVTEITLDLAAKMYIYTQNIRAFHIEWLHFYNDLFTRFTPRYILLNLADLSKMNTGGSSTKDIPWDLIQKLREALKLK